MYYSYSAIPHQGHVLFILDHNLSYLASAYQPQYLDLSFWASKFSASTFQP